MLLRSATTLAVLCLVCSGATSAFAQLAESPWPDYGGGYANQHRSPNRGPSTTPYISWSYDLTTLPISVSAFRQPSLLPDGSLVFNVGATYGNCGTLSLTSDGTFRWYRQYYDTILGPWLAADQQGHVYLIRGDRSSTWGDYTEHLKALDFDGNVLWQVGVGQDFNNAQNGPAIGRDGTIYAAADYSTLYGITPSGEKSWASPAASGYYVNPAVATDGTIYVGGNALTALNPDGTVKWSYASGHTVVSPAIGDDGTIFAGKVNNSMLVAFDPDGNLLWSRSDLNGAPTVGLNGDVYVVTESGILYALDPSDGSMQWTYATGTTGQYDREGVTVDADGNLYLCNTDGLLMSLTSDGQLRWNFDLAPDKSGFIGPSAPVIGNDGTLYVGGGYTRLFFAMVPEPSNLVLLGIGLVSLLARASRQAKHRA